MVRYNGRQKLLTSTLNTNQIGLKMSGTAPSVGSSISARRYTKRRVRDNLKFCGPVYYHGQLWSHNSGDSCVKRAPKNQSLAGGVGRINNPRTKCNIKCMSDKDYDTITFSLINIRVLDYDDDDGLTEQYTNVLGYLSPNLLNIYNTKGYLESQDLNLDSSWAILPKEVSDRGNDGLVLTFKYTDTDGIHRIINNPPILNGIKLEFRFVDDGDNSFLVIFFINNLSLEAGRTYTLSFPDENPSKAPLPIINNKDDIQTAIDVYNINKNIYQPPNNWDVSKVTDMSSLFEDEATFNADISKWDTSNVTNMRNMFLNATTFNADISKWDTSNVEDMSYMFFNAIRFNQNLSGWNVSNVTNFVGMFSGATDIKTEYDSNPALPNTPIKSNWGDYWL